MGSCGMDPEQCPYGYLQRSPSRHENGLHVHWKLNLDPRAIQTRRRAVQRHVPSQGLLGESLLDHF